MASRGPFKIVAVATSAGGLTVLQNLLAQLPPSFPAPIIILQHVDPSHHSYLAEILGRQTKLTVKDAQAGEEPLPNHVYVAPPDRHLLVDSDRKLVLSDSAPVHFVRPSADLLFDSIAENYGKEALVLVLTGTGSDASGGVATIKKLGGAVIVQDPKEAEFPGMPSAAIAACDVDFILPLTGAVEKLYDLVEAGQDE